MFHIVHQKLHVVTICFCVDRHTQKLLAIFVNPIGIILGSISLVFVWLYSSLELISQTYMEISSNVIFHLREFT